MVSKASEDFPEPDRPVMTTSRSRGISTSMSLRLCSRAPRIAITRASGQARSRLWSKRSFMGPANVVRTSAFCQPGGGIVENFTRRRQYADDLIIGSALIAWMLLFGRDRSVKGLDRFAAAKPPLTLLSRPKTCHPSDQGLSQRSQG